jgi:hypothetical protein
MLVAAAGALIRALGACAFDPKHPGAPCNDQPGYWTGGLPSWFPARLIVFAATVCLFLVVVLIRMAWLLDRGGPADGRREDV